LSGTRWARTIGFSYAVTWSSLTRRPPGA